MIIKRRLAKPIWGALTAKLTRRLGLSDYKKIGNFLKKAMRFGYFYIYSGNKIFVPYYTEEGLKFGNLMQSDFEKIFISSVASTAIESHSLTAEEGMLHEVEFVSPYTINEGQPVFLKGLLWIREFSEENLSVDLDDDFSIVYNNLQIKLSELIDILQVGGERRYGFEFSWFILVSGFNSHERRNFQNHTRFWPMGERMNSEEVGHSTAISLPCLALLGHLTADKREIKDFLKLH